MLKLFRFLKPYHVQVVNIMLLTFLQALSQLFLPALMADMVDKGIVTGNIQRIITIGGTMLLVAVGSVLFSIWSNYYSSRAAMGFSKDLRNEIFTRVNRFSLQDIDKIGTSSLITRSTNDVMQVQQVITMMMKVFIMAPMMCIGGLLIAFSTDIKLSFIILSSFPIIAACIYFIVRKGMPLFKVLQKKLDRINLLLKEGLSGVRVIRSFNRAEDEKKRFKEEHEDYTKTAIAVNKMMALLTPAMTLILNFSIILILWLGSFRVNGGSMQVGELMAFIQYTMQIMFALILSSVMFVLIPRVSVSASRINEVLETVPDKEVGVHQCQTANLKDGIQFKHVTFTYPGAEKPALSDLSFKLKKGEVTAVIGGTGAGKTTLARLLPRLYEADKGRILFDGVNVKDISQKNLRDLIGFVSQKSILFAGTITDNLRFGKNEASDEEIKAAAETAQISEFIAKTKKGYHSVLAQRGANVSGGQKQRLSIARALIRKPSLYIFDDSFSALDFQTEKKLRTALKHEVKNAVVMIVSQKISTVRDADQIIVLDQGKMAGIGRHEELLESCTVYREMVVNQQLEEDAI